MINTEMLSYIGALTGVVGAIAGIAGSIMGYFSLRRTGEIKALELRLELVKAATDVFQKIDSVGDLLARARKSRDAVAAATGMYHSGARQTWQRQFEADYESLNSINESFDELNVDFSSFSLRELERSISELYGLRTFLENIAQRNAQLIAEDDLSREAIRSRMGGVSLNS
ncbi:hypothetical protein [Variovorax sp. R-27]|uniref:hypothetical protein n=1 Tax=Variovorax sp. R-27 TaxID=3404058 RepID=UPI003CE6DD3B